MSSQCGKLISLILKEHFGEVVEKIGYHLFKYGVCPLWLIVKYTELPVAKVKLALCILIKYGLVTFEPGKNDALADYKIDSNSVLRILRYPKFVSHIKKLFGEEAEILLEETLTRGYAKASDLITQVQTRLKKNGEKNLSQTLVTIRDKLISLVTAKYLKRYPENLPETEKFTLPQINLAKINSEPGDNEIYWTVNFDRFNQDFRDQLIINAVLNRFDENAAELIKVMLQQMYVRTQPWADVSAAIPFVEIKDVIRKSQNNQILVYLEHYLTVLADDESRFISKVGDASGGQFCINLKNAIEQLTWATVENVVLEKFDTKAARIFRLVRAKKYIEPDQIQQLAMIPSKEAKRLSYQLLEENFLQLQELRKTSAAGSGPNKSFVLFHIDLDQVVRMVLELCLKSLYNAMTRRHYDKAVNKRIIDKKHRVDTIAMSLKVQGAPEEQLADIEEMITPPEKEMLEKIGKIMKRLNLAELEIDDTIHLIQLYLSYFSS